MFSIIIRIFGGVVGVVMLFSMIMSGNFSVGQGRFGWLMPLLPIVFILYAIGGLNFFRKYLPFFVEKEVTLNSEIDKSEKK